MTMLAEETETLVTKHRNLNPPVVIPTAVNSGLPLMLQFAKTPRLAEPLMGNPTYMGATGNKPDYENDDAGGSGR